MIEYDNITMHDGYYYWNDAPVFIVDIEDSSKVEVARLFIPLDEEHEDGDAPFEEADLQLFSLKGDLLRRVSSHTLFRKSGLITQRISPEYLEHDNHLYRVISRGGERYRYKGTYQSPAGSIPVLEGHDYSLPLSNLSDRRSYLEAIARVLSYGLAPCMRPYTSPAVAKERVMNAVRSMLRSDGPRGVIVPDFQYAILKTGDVATVLRSG